MSPKSARDWRLYAEDIIEACGKVRRFVGGMSYDAFADDERTQDAVMRNLEIIGEASKNIPDGRRRGSPRDRVAEHPRHARHPRAWLLRRVARDRLGDGDDADRRARGCGPQASRCAPRVMTPNLVQIVPIIAWNHVVSGRLASTRLICRPHCPTVQSATTTPVCRFVSSRS